MDRGGLIRRSDGDQDPVVSVGVLLDVDVLERELLDPRLCAELERGDLDRDEPRPVARGQPLKKGSPFVAGDFLRRHFQPPFPPSSRGGRISSREDARLVPISAIRKRKARIAYGEDSPADAIARFEEGGGSVRLR